MAVTIRKTQRLSFLSWLKHNMGRDTLKVTILGMALVIFTLLLSIHE